MKKLYFLFYVSMIVSVSSAQFSADSSHPMQLCTIVSNQTNVQSLSDGSGGYFVFWLDNRVNASNKQVYAQRVNHDGVAQWLANGKAITDTTNNIKGYRVARWQSGMIIAWIHQGLAAFQDTVYCKYIDTSGNDVWTQPAIIAQAGNSFLYMDLPAFNVFPNDSGATITHSYTYSGGSSGLTFNRIDFSGNLYWSVLSKTFPLIGYDYRSQSDGQNGFYAISKGNGIGSTMYVQRFDLQGNAMWNNPLDITSGGAPNGFAGNITMHDDTQHNLYVVWDASGYNIDVTKVTAQGNFAWAARRLLLSDSSTFYPQRSSSRLIGDTLYVTWFENRPAGVYSSIIQKIDSAGNELWTPGGMIIDTVSPVYCYPKIAASDSGTIVNTFLRQGNIDFAVQKIRPDGSFVWNANGKALSSAALDVVAYDDYALNDDATGCNAVFWASFNADIFGADACRDTAQITTGITDDAKNGYGLYPNPNGGEATLRIFAPNNAEISVRVNDVTGKEVLSLHKELLRGTNLVPLDISGCANGIYFVNVRSSSLNHMLRMVVNQ